MPDWLDSLSVEEREALERSDLPDWVDPMLATLTDDYFSDPGWIYERKLDGQRCLAYRNGSGVRLRSRNRTPNEDRYPEIVEAVASLAPDTFILDGEVVAFEDGRSSFERLQPRLQVNDAEEARRSPVTVYYYVFDLLHLEGYDTTGLPQRTRKALLRRVLSFNDPLRYTPHRNEEGKAYRDEACRKGWEGIIAKRADAPYRSRRSTDWLKFKCVVRQEFVVGGYTDPEGERIGFGALLIGYYEGDALRYAGKVGTGFDDDTLEHLRDRLDRRSRTTPPFDAGDLPSDGVHWVRPDLVAEIAFTEWTPHGKLRHPRYLGLRDDKDPTEVVRETPVS